MHALSVVHFCEAPWVLALASPDVSFFQLEGSYKSRSACLSLKGNVEQTSKQTG